MTRAKRRALVRRALAMVGIREIANPFDENEQLHKKVAELSAALLRLTVELEAAEAQITQLSVQLQELGALEE